MSYNVIKINDDTYRIEDGHVRFFLLIGSKKALLIDSGMTTTNALDIVKSYTSLPIILVNTHADRDHIAGNDAFETFYMHPSEYCMYFKTKKGNPTPIWDNDEIDIGNRIIKVIHIPGHTPGSIALLDMKFRVLISGDPIQDGRIYMFGPYRNLIAYKQSLIKIKTYIDDFDFIYPSHGSFPLKGDIIDKLINAVDILKDKQPISNTINNIEIDEYHFDFATFLCDKK